MESDATFVEDVVCLGIGELMVMPDFRHWLYRQCALHSPDTEGLRSDVARRLNEWNAATWGLDRCQALLCLLA